MVHAVEKWEARNRLWICLSYWCVQTSCYVTPASYMYWKIGWTVFFMWSASCTLPSNGALYTPLKQYRGCVFSLVRANEISRRQFCLPGSCQLGVQFCMCGCEEESCKGAAAKRRLHMWYLDCVIQCDSYSFCIKIRCLEKPCEVSNILRTLVWVCQWSVKFSHESWENKWPLYPFTSLNHFNSHKRKSWQYIVTFITRWVH
jgi:hypothetical protein